MPNAHDLDTLRNQLIACQQRSIKLDQARIDAEALTSGGLTYTVLQTPLQIKPQVIT